MHLVPVRILGSCVSLIDSFIYSTTACKIVIESITIGDTHECVAVNTH